MIFNDVTKMVIDGSNYFFPVLVGLNVALVVSAAALFATSAFEPWLAALGRFVRRQLTFNRPVLAR